ncbi:hypothetical protein SKAU_G00297430 [Synaphobranchus kaupii]|uniref:HAUS augmin-like complex subunit 7 n=1 Tax=Synaphobranchus kaupii TaxID=118154 RepID=A0A9Q1IKS3_SYNKA|nr:hypothetical protein SKAU_G00297430 [Synaphobranchus kaupii]
MAGTLKEKQLVERVYSKLQGLGCPLVEGLFLQDADSMKELLCTSSLHRTDILKWICVSCCPSLKEKFSALRSTQTDALIQEILRFGHEIMLCRPDDLDLIKGLAPPLRQLHFLEQLLALVPVKQTQSAELSVGQVLGRSEEFMGELMSVPHMGQLTALLNPACSPWSADLRELLLRRAPQGKTGQSRPACGKPAEDTVVKASALLQSTQSVLEDLRKECVFLQPGGVSPSPRLSPCALRLAITDLSQLMTAFSQSFNTELKGYCQRRPPALSPNAQSFYNVHQLLLTCNQELQALQQLTETSSAASATVNRVQTDRKYWGDGQKYTLPARLEGLRKKYTEFLSLRPA